MEFRTQYSDPLEYQYFPDQDVEVDGFQPNGVESVGQMIARLKAGGTAPFFEAVDDLGLGQFIDEFDLQDALESGAVRSAADESAPVSAGGDRKSDSQNKNGAAGETPPPATGE